MKTLQAKSDGGVSRIVVLATGGTIAGRAASAGDNLGYVAGQVGIADLTAAVPSLSSEHLELEQVAQIDSCDMGFAVWQRLVSRLAFHLARPEVQAVVITHGTDTLEETAFFLQSVLQPAKPVVMTCAMRPSTALVPDGPQNLSDAVAVAKHVGARGVVVVCAGQVHLALDVNKVHTYRLDAFDSGDAGALACVEEGRLRLFRSWSGAPDNAQDGAPFDAAGLLSVEQADGLPRVELLFSHADADGSVVRALLAHSQAHPQKPLRGLVVAGTGNGSVHAALSASLHEAQAVGVRVVVASRCARGRVIAHGGSTFADSAGLSPVKARIALILELLRATKNPA